MKAGSVKVNIGETETIIESGTSYNEVFEANYPKDEGKYPIIAVLANGILLSLSDKVKLDSKCTPIHLDSSIGFDIFRRSLSFALSAVCYSMFPDRKLEVVISCSKGISYKLSGNRISSEEWDRLVSTLRGVTGALGDKGTNIYTDELLVNDACSYFKATQRKEVSDLINQKRDGLYRHNSVKVSTMNLKGLIGDSETSELKYSTLFIDPMVPAFNTDNAKYFDNYEIMREGEYGRYGGLFKNYFVIALPDGEFLSDMKSMFLLPSTEETGGAKEVVKGDIKQMRNDAFYEVIPSHLHESLIKYYKTSSPYSNDYVSQLNSTTHKLNQTNLEFAVGKMNNGAYKLANKRYSNEDPTDKSFSIVHYSELYIRQQLADICSIVSDKTHLILICGPSSSGKTTFSHRLAEALTMHSKYPKVPVVLGMDMYYQNKEDCPKLKEVTKPDGSVEIIRDFEHPDALKIDLINQHLRELIEGKEVAMPFFDFSEGKSYEGRGKKIKLYGIKGEHERDNNEGPAVGSIEGDVSYPLPPSGCIIMEGIHGLNPAFSSSIPNNEKLLIFIHPHTLIKIDPITPFRSTYDRLLRRSVRDARSRGYSIATTVSRWPSVRSGEVAHIFKTSENGNFIFNSIHEIELPALSGIYDASVNLDKEAGYDDDEELGAIHASLLTSMNYITRMSATAIKNEIPSDSILREFIGGLLFGEPH